MKSYFTLTLLVLSGMLFTTSCEKNKDNQTGCQTFTLNKAFTAEIGETWCAPSSAWKITFGPQIEDSRCNVVDVECVWAGRYVLAATIDNGEIIQDTFFAVDNWRDTLYNGPYTIILDKVKPEIRTTTDPLPASAYSLDIIIR